MSNKKEVPCHWNIIKLTKPKTGGLIGLSIYDQAFLGELDISKVKDTDACISVIKEFCTSRKVNYEVQLIDELVKDYTVIYKK